MSNENYFNYYVEALQKTMTDAVMSTVSLQASVRISEETIKELEKTIELLDAEIGKMREDFEQEKMSIVNQVNTLNSELLDLRQKRSEYDSAIGQSKHLDTFRNELVKSREENDKLKLEYELKIKNLNEKIDYLQLTPAKRKKIDEEKTTKELQINNKEHIEDGGSF
jgi:chromosome segregation ATPase